MGHAIHSIQAAEIECWRIVNQSAVLASDEEMAGEIDIGSSPVDERGPNLRARDNADTSRLDRALDDAWRHDVVWVENQSTCACQHKR